ncbi:MAG: AbrB family transcriptional regulator, partial [Hyphomicrobiaceae bacterium]|nr:AbrB family transcriptional regulator [Hyphomicrobiaceae bacterium]
MTFKFPENVMLRAALCIALAFAGGLTAAYLRVPLPYMLGAIFVTMVAALAGVPVARPAKEVVLPMRVVLGVMLGSTVTPELLDRVWAIAGSALLVPVFAIVSTAVGLVYYHRVAGYSREEAFFCAVPGGLHVMTTYAEETGVDIRRVSLAHALRITFVVLLAPLATQMFVALPDVAAVRNAATFADSRIWDLVLLTGAGFVGWLIGRSTGMPGAQMVGPMLASAALHVGGITAAKPPGEAIIVSQVILGAYIGSRYVGEKLAIVRDAIFYAFGHVTMMLCIGFAFAHLLHSWLGVPVL